MLRHRRALARAVSNLETAPLFLPAPASPNKAPTTPFLKKLQIKVSSLAMPIYSLLPALAEAAVERGWTRAYPHISDVGLVWHLIYFVLYMTSVEFGVYWNHRLLHEIRWAYKYLHEPHHKYNKVRGGIDWAGELDSRRAWSRLFFARLSASAAGHPAIERLAIRTPRPQKKHFFF